MMTPFKHLLLLTLLCYFVLKGVNVVAAASALEEELSKGNSSSGFSIFGNYLVNKELSVFNDIDVSTNPLTLFVPQNEAFDDTESNPLEAKVNEIAGVTTEQYFQYHVVEGIYGNLSDMSRSSFPRSGKSWFNETRGFVNFYQLQSVFWDSLFSSNPIHIRLASQGASSGKGRLIQELEDEIIVTNSGGATVYIRQVNTPVAVMPPRKLTDELAELNTLTSEFRALLLNHSSQFTDVTASNQVTVFVPFNDAFEVSVDALDGMDSTERQAVVDRHIVNSVLTAKDLKDAADSETAITTKGGDDITVEKDGNKIVLTFGGFSATIGESDFNYHVHEGIVHIVDRLIGVERETPAPVVPTPFPTFSGPDDDEEGDDDNGGGDDEENSAFSLMSPISTRLGPLGINFIAVTVTVAASLLVAAVVPG